MKKLSISTAAAIVLAVFALTSWSAQTLQHTDRWMAELEQAAPAAMDQPLARFILPGSHDAGTYRLAPFLACEGCKGADTFLDVVEKCNDYVGLGLSCDTFLSQVAIPWARAQNRSVRGQLEAGARSLDLRFFRATMADQTRTLGLLRAGRFYVHHTVVGPDLSEILHDIKTFLQEPGHNREVIILRFYKLSEGDGDMSTSSLQVFYDQVRAELGSASCSTHSSCGYLAPAPDPGKCLTDSSCVATARLGANATIRQILDQGSQVIMTEPSGDITGPDLWENPTNPDPSFTSGYPLPDDDDHPWRTDREFLRLLQDLVEDRTSQSELFILGVHIGMDDDAKTLIRSYVCKADAANTNISGQCPAPNHDWDHFQDLSGIAAYTNRMSLPAISQLPRDLVNVIHADQYSPEFTEEVFKLNLGATRTAVNISRVRELTSHDTVGSPDYYPHFFYNNVPPMLWALHAQAYAQIPDAANIAPAWPGWKAYPNDWGFASIDFGINDADPGDDDRSLINGNSTLKTVTIDITGCVLNSGACPSSGLLTTSGPASGSSGSSSVDYSYAACVWSWLPGQNIDPLSTCNDAGRVLSPEVSILDVTQKEGTDNSPTKFDFIVTLSPPQARPIAIFYKLIDDRATSPDDFVGPDEDPNSGVITFDPGQSQKIITVKVTADDLVEQDDDFTVKIGDNFPAEQNLDIVRDTATGLILNDDDYKLRIADFSGAEGTACQTTPFNFIVSLSQPSNTPVTVRYGTSNGPSPIGAESPGDYVAVPETLLTFNPGETSKTVTVSIVCDAAVEPDEIFTVKFFSPTHAVLENSTATGTILNDEIQVVAINPQVNHFEPDSGTRDFVFTVSLSAPSLTPITVDYKTEEGSATAGSDYVGLTSSVTLAPNQTVAQIIVKVIGDTKVEPNETFMVKLLKTTGGGVIDSNHNLSVGTINDDDPLLQISDLERLEGTGSDTTFKFTVSSNINVNKPLTVHYKTSDGTATAGSDYDAAPDTVLTFACNPNTGVCDQGRDIIVNVEGDSLSENDETFFVDLSQMAGGEIGKSRGVGTIMNDDVNQPPTLTAGPFSVSEGSSVVLNATGNDPEERPLTYAWDLDNDGAFETAGQSPTFSTAQLDGPSVHTVRVQVTDDHNQSVVASTQVTVNNVSPTGSLSNSGAISEGGTAQVSFSSQSDPSTADAMAGFHYAYSCAAASLSGATYANSSVDAVKSCSFADNGSFPVRARIVDKDDGFTEYTTTVTVNNLAPTITNVMGSTIDENRVATVGVAFIDPGTPDTFVLTVEWGDGSMNQYALAAGTGSYTATHQYLDDNPTGTPSDLYQVMLTVVDDDTGESAAPATVTVNNTPPVIGSLIASDETGVMIDGFALTHLNVDVTALFSDAGAQDTHTGEFDWGDGTKGPGSVSEAGGTGALNGSHSWSNPGNVTVSVTVIDDDKGSVTRAAMFTVLDPSGAVCALAGRVAALVNSNSELDSSTITALTKLAGQIQGNDGGQAFNGACDMFAKGNDLAGAVKVTQAVGTIEDLLTGTSLNADQKTILRAVEDGLILTAKSTYLGIVRAAGQENPDAAIQRKLADAAALATLADDAIAAGDRVAAIDYWTRAIRVLAP